MIYFISYTVMKRRVDGAGFSVSPPIDLQDEQAALKPAELHNAIKVAGIGRITVKPLEAPPPKKTLVVGEFQEVQPYITAESVFCLFYLNKFSLSAPLGTSRHTFTVKDTWVGLNYKVPVRTLTSGTCSVLANRQTDAKKQKAQTVFREGNLRLNHRILGLKTNRSRYLSESLNCKVFQKKSAEWFCAL